MRCIFLGATSVLFAASTAILWPAAAAAEGARARKASPTPAVIVTKVMVEGPLDRDSVGVRLDKSLGPVRRCYARRLRSSKGLGGDMALGLHVGTRGRVTAATVLRSTVGDEPLERCALQRAESLRFHPPSDAHEAKVAYHLHFGVYEGVLGVLSRPMPKLDALFPHSPGPPGFEKVVTEETAPWPPEPSKGGLDRRFPRKGEGTPRPVVEIGKVATVGSLRPTDVQEDLRRRRSKLRKCFAPALRKQHDLAGEVAVRLAIDHTGKVIHAKVSSSSLKRERVEACALGVLRSIVFLEPSGGGVVLMTTTLSFWGTWAPSEG